MYELMAVSHDGLTLEKIAEIPLKETRQPLLQWVDVGARNPIRLAMHGDPNVLRKMQQSLAFHGVRTEVQAMRASASGRYSTDHEVPAPPPTHDSFVSPPSDTTAQDSGLHQYRQMVKEMDARRSSATQVIATSVGGFRPAHLIPLVILAIIGVILAIASRGG